MVNLLVVDWDESEFGVHIPRIHGKIEPVHIVHVGVEPNIDAVQKELGKQVWELREAIPSPRANEDFVWYNLASHTPGSFAYMRGWQRADLAQATVETIEGTQVTYEHIEAKIRTPGLATQIQEALHRARERGFIEENGYQRDATTVHLLHQDATYVFDANGFLELLQYSAQQPKGVAAFFFDRKENREARALWMLHVARHSVTRSSGILTPSYEALEETLSAYEEYAGNARLRYFGLKTFQLKQVIDSIAHDPEKGIVLGESHTETPVTGLVQLTYTT